MKNAHAQSLLYSATSPLLLSAYCDADWGACPATRKSITGYTVFLGSSLISWRSKKQTVVSCFSFEAEYRAMTQACREIVWVHSLLTDFHVVAPTPIWLHCDNLTAIHITRNPVFHERTKHIEMNCHLIRHHFAAGFILHVLPKHVPSN